MKMLQARFFNEERGSYGVSIDYRMRQGTYVSRSREPQCHCIWAHIFRSSTVYIYIAIRSFVSFSYNVARRGLLTVYTSGYTYTLTTFAIDYQPPQYKPNKEKLSKE